MIIKQFNLYIYIFICRDLELEGKVMVLLMVKYGMLVPLKPVDLIRNSHSNTGNITNININMNINLKINININININMIIYIL